jgi:hypothetical protein
MRVTNKIRKDINKLAKLVTDDPASKYVLNEKCLRIELGISRKGLRKYLTQQVESGELLPSTLVYLIEANLRSNKRESE